LLDSGPPVAGKILYVGYWINSNEYEYDYDYDYDYDYEQEEEITKEMPWREFSHQGMIFFT